MLNVDLYDNWALMEETRGVVEPDGIGGFVYDDGCRRLYADPDGLGGYTVGGDERGFILPNALGGMDYYPENGPVVTMLPEFP